MSLLFFGPKVVLLSSVVTVMFNIRGLILLMKWFQVTSVNVFIRKLTTAFKGCYATTGIGLRDFIKGLQKSLNAKTWLLFWKDSGFFEIADILSIDYDMESQLQIKFNINDP